MNLSGYRWMWVIAMFDLPVATKADRKRYAQFRKRLLSDGFARMQFSVYIRHAASRENAEVHMARLERAVPENGEVRAITVTDKQFERMRVFWGKLAKTPEAPRRNWNFSDGLLPSRPYSTATYGKGSVIDPGPRATRNCGDRAPRSHAV